MVKDLTKPPTDNRSFCGVPVANDLAALQAEIAILGIPYGTTYDVESPVNESAGSPSAIRARSGASMLYHHDFDIDAAVLNCDDRDIAIADCGDVAGGPHPGDGETNRAMATGAVKAILDAGAVPIVFGGDDSVPIPFFAAFEGRGPFTVVQVDAHLDWRDEIHGSRYGYSSPMRRASEMDWINGMVQIGLRGYRQCTAPGSRGCAQLGLQAGHSARGSREGNRCSAATFARWRRIPGDDRL